MNKQKKGRKFSHKGTYRSFLCCLAENLVLRERIKTTQARAKELSPFIEKLLTKAKKNDLQGRRIILRSLSEKATQKMIEEIAPRYKDRAGGYTRVLKLEPRRSDGAKMAFIELLK